MSDRQIARHEPGIRALAPLKAVTTSDQVERVEELRKARLLHEMDPAQHGLDGPLIKIYVALEGQRASRDERSEIRRLRLCIDKWRSVKLTSLYYGSADAAPIRCLIKCVVEVGSFPNITPAIAHLNELLEEEGLEWRTNTLLVATNQPYESDFLDPDYSEGHPPELFQLARMLSEPAAEVAYSSPFSEAARTLFKDHRALLLDTPFERYFLGILEAGLLGDSNLLEERLVFYFHIDLWLNRWLVSRMFPSAWGPEWKDVLETTLADYNRDKHGKEVVRFSPGESGLGDIVKTIGVLAQGGGVDLTEIDSVIGPDWLDTLRPSVRDRNDLAHGKLGEALARNGVASWRDVARRAFSAAPVYIGLWQRFAVEVEA